MARRMEEQPEVLGLPAASLEDKDLTLAFQSGDKGAYQAIYDRYSDRVHNVCRRMLGNPQDAQEAAQESFLRVYQALGRFNGRYQLGAWITRIATNVCLDQLRARSRRPSDVAQLDVIDLELDRHHDVDGPELVVLQNAESRRVRKVLSKLPPLHRAAIVLRDFEGLSYAEVAVALQLSECQVKALIHRARQNFKRSWTPLSLLMPWRLLTRVKEVDAGAREHLSQAVATTAQIAPTCTTTLQQCGQYVAERVAPIFTAAVLGAAVGGAAVAKSNTPAPREKTRTESAPLADQPKSGALLAGAEPRTPKGSEEKERSADPLEEDEAVTPPAPAASPSATPSTSPQASPSPEPSPSNQPTAKPTKPERAPFAAALGFERGGPPPATVPTGNRTWVDCDPTGITQRLETSFSDGAHSYPAALSLKADGTSVALELSIWKNERQIHYTGEGALSGGSRNGSELSLEFSGNYRTGNQEAKDALGLPISGSFKGAFTLDCTWSELLSETLTFSGQ